MLYQLHHLEDVLRGLGLLRHAEVRAALAAIIAFAIAVIFGRWFIRRQRSTGALEKASITDSGRLNALHAGKNQTPTMGGVIILVSVPVATLLGGQPGCRWTYLLPAILLAFGALGFVDDSIKLRRGTKGLKARTKLICQILLGGLLGLYLVAFPIEVQYPHAAGELGTAVLFPFFKHAYLPLGGLFVVLVILVTTAASNAVNLTDGIDGLAIGCSILIGVTFVTLAFLAGYERASDLLQIPHVEGGAEIAVFSCALVGAGLGFLWFNCHPAQIFMGDTGALALGGAIGTVALLLKQEILLVLIAGVLVAEALSVVLQVLSFKLRGKRIFLIAPLHHHFQFLGWAETKVTVRFWIAGAILALISLITLRIR
ncbi:MAG: phospho-N-acetylmuramoyl-pentapeptide-transferase [Planctomycetes bacterium]|nr:phospho-N-acetylmuramoyl-pentapeptide-transferase [Planctomycetota bacterium]